MVNYILAAVKQGKPLDLTRFKRQCADVGCAPPSETEWNQLLSAVNENTGADVTQTQLLAAFIPEAAKSSAERTAAEQATVIKWHQKLAWFLALRHAGLPPSFE